MFNKISPEQAGIRSNDIYNYISMLNDRNLSMHGIIMMKGDNILFESYYAPFTKESIHRLYSETKSFVSIAIGLLVEEQKISLNDKLYTYFEDKIDHPLQEWIKNQTIKDTLMMSTSIRCENWFKAKEDDRVKLYFNQTPIRPSGLTFEYDSAGSMVLSALVEKVTGMTLFNYLKAKLFDKMGTFQTAYMLKAPCNYSWGDSGMMATLRDVASFGRLVMQYGIYENQRLMGEYYLKEATKNQINNHEVGFEGYRSNGYGYQIWRCEYDGFAFFGMGNQLTIMFPKQDILFACVANDQGNPSYRELIFNGLYEIIKKANDKPLKENKEEYQQLIDLESSQTLRYQKTIVNNTLINSINNITYQCKENPIGMKEFKLSFDNNKGIFTYKNSRGIKHIYFGINQNEFFKFEEEGYSNLVGKEITNDYYYQCAASIKFTSDFQLKIDVKFIDKYLGNLFIMISFKEDTALIRMSKHAENFINDYQGEVIAYK